MLSFDHVSLVGPSEALAGAGLRLTPTLGDERHARVHLDGSYLELSSTGQSVPLTGLGWFLRAADPSRVAPALTALGVHATDATPYHGVDGTWSDISVGATELGAVAPVITQRVDRVDWPPRSGDTHPNGAVVVAGLELATPDPEALAELLRRLGAIALRGVVLPSSATGSFDLGALRLTLTAAGRPALTALILRTRDGRQLRMPLSA